MLNYSRDHSVAEGLAYTVTWNSAMLQTEVNGKSENINQIFNDCMHNRIYLVQLRHLSRRNQQSIQSFKII